MIAPPRPRADDLQRPGPGSGMQPEIKLRLTSGDPLRCHLPQRHQLRLVVREPRCSICREHHTICTAIAPDEVRTVRM